MSTEQQQPPATAPKSEPNALASGLTTGWDKFKQGKIIGYPMMALILVVVTAIGVGWWIVSERRKADSVRWAELDGLVSVAALEDFAKKNPDTIQAKIANLNVARTHLGPEGIDRMLVRESDTQAASAEEAARRTREIRATAVANVEKAREEFDKLVDEFKDDPVIRVECLYSRAKAEAVLIGVPKEVAPDPTKILEAAQSRGDPAKAVELFDKVTEAAPDTDWGKDAKKLADVLRNQNKREQVQTLQSRLFDLLTPSVGPKGDFDPLGKMPRDANHGFPPRP